MKICTLLNLNDDETYETIEQEIMIEYNNTRCYYTIERDNEGGITDIEGYHKIVKELHEDGKVSISNNDELVMDAVLSGKNYDLMELDQLLFDMYVDDDIKFTCKVINQDYEDETVTVYITLLENNVTPEAE